jgi:hypothetical protein
MKFRIKLNDYVKAEIPFVEEVFLFDDDENDLILHSILKHPDGTNFQYASITNGLQRIKKTTVKITIYKMPNGKKCAVSYPTSVKVNYDHFEDGVRKLFKHVNKNNTWHKNSYAFYLFCVKNGFKGILSKH